MALASRTNECPKGTAGTGGRCDITILVFCRHGSTGLAPAIAYRSVSRMIQEPLPKSFKESHCLRSVFLMALAALAAACPLPSYAHHSFAAFDRSQKGVVTGTLKVWQWTNPHTWLFVEVPEGGKDVEYSFEGYSPLMLPRFGVKRDTYKPGDKVTVTYFPRKDHTNGGQFVGIVPAGAAPVQAPEPTTAPAGDAAPNAAPAPDKDAPK